ncbi:16S rRNA (cytosine(1402)-N(4))-methyltransferase [Candidatus Shapirobacteria bacterium CG09_land_8_20_14_0_10_38_17]|uniref:Ribosomal RNA small subunit methyltransferase H n=1 Tax=Candidatus Shapirobacteria bacterium CG09_land_8_20_14_0_10_38_17 TaxID=1974884 RepID=A0A2H0WR79_9BACT|nr:MAG: 16S rRNA (cytosine(1402)-N(4))-methyltransferase [Candidatus Shapirobacteria bacterium CG09_land_8_20_14_0_10_38_17]
MAKISKHTPVLLQTAIKYLNVKPNRLYIDATLGGGGHAEAILKKGGRVLGIDCDPEALEIAQKRLAQACPNSLFSQKGEASEQDRVPPKRQWQLIKGNFAYLENIAKEARINRAEGILFDLGVNTYQLTSKRRGFSFKSRAPLDMRMDPNLNVTAADLIAVLSENELYQIFTKFSQEQLARPIARAIVGARKVKPIKTCQELTIIIEGVYQKRGKIHPATKVFQALRIAVNDELNNLKKALPQALRLLKKGGNLVIISFHEGEDRIVKNFLRENSQAGRLKIMTKKVVRPNKEEIITNPRSRSARLRAGQKI